ncbi:MAG TPA: hypothetical protein VMB22_02795, partial [Verrucomicrobiae bacterium]|nr:hypothetical protein [Verrucomicrobiae bacterium]
PINPGTPGGAVPPMKKSTGRVQPKKETVRINLPPKPTAAPTIKLPTLPPGGPTGASSPMPSPGGISPAAPAMPRPGAPRSAAAPMAPARPAAVSQRAVAAPAAAPTVSALDKILAIAACVMALGAVGTTVWMMLMLNNALSS